MMDRVADTPKHPVFAQDGGNTFIKDTASFLLPRSLPGSHGKVHPPEVLPPSEWGTNGR